MTKNSSWRKQVKKSKNWAVKMNGFFHEIVIRIEDFLHLNEDFCHLFTLFCHAQVPQALTVNKNQSSQKFSTSEKTKSKVFSVKYEHKYFVSYYLMNNEKQKYSRGLKTSILGPKLGSFLVQFFFDDYSFFMKKAIFFFVLHEEFKTEENATSTTYLP